MERYNNILCVDLSELTRSDDGPAVMSRDAYHHLQQRSRINVVRRGGGLETGALIEYATLPDRFKARYIEKYGDPELRNIEEKMEFRMDTKAREFFFGDSLALPTNIAERYTVNASALRMLSGMKARMVDSHHVGGSGRGVFWDAIMEESERLRRICGHTLPRSERLREVLRRFETEGYGSLISGKLGNSNGRTITEEMGRLIIALKRSKDPVYSNEAIRRKVNAVAMEKGWKQIRSKGTIENYLSGNVALWKDTEVGTTKAKMMLNRMHSTILPTVPNARWEGDGTKVNLYYRTYVDGKEKMATFWVYEFIDVASEVMLGRAFGQGEDFRMFYDGFRNAVENVGVFPYELVNDNQSSATTRQVKEWLSRCVQVPRTSAPHNGPSKAIESVFGRFQTEVLSKHWNSTGQNVTSKKDSSRPDIDFTERNVASLPNYQECVAMYEADVQAWNNSLHPDQARYQGMTRMDVFRSSSCPDCAALSDASRKDAFWITSQKSVRYTNNGFRVTIDGSQFIYEVQTADGYPDLEWLDAHNQHDFWYRYDPYDLSVIKLYTFDPKTGYRYVADAATKQMIHRDIWSQNEFDAGYIRGVEQRVKEHTVKRHLMVKEIEKEFGTAPEQHGLVSPLPAGVTKTEYRRISERLAAGNAVSVPDGPDPEDIYPDTVGQVRKRISGLDYEALNNL